MTDKEIIKALEHCIKFIDCTECPYKGITKCSVEADALDLIKRQQAEIERSNCHIQKLVNVTDDLVHECDCAKQEAIKEFAERLKEAPIKCSYPLFGLSTKDEIIEYFNDIMMQVRDAIDNLVKEMTGETKTDTDFPKDYSYGY